MVYKRFSAGKTGGTRSIPGPPAKAGSKKNKGRTGRAGGAITPTPVKRTKGGITRGKAGKMVARKKR